MHGTFTVIVHFEAEVEAGAATSALSVTFTDCSNILRIIASIDSSFADTASTRRTVSVIAISEAINFFMKLPPFNFQLRFLLPPVCRHGDLAISSEP